MTNGIARWVDKVVCRVFGHANEPCITVESYVKPAIHSQPPRVGSYSSASSLEVTVSFEVVQCRRCNAIKLAPPSRSVK